jgi:hypothetical protein
MSKRPSSILRVLGVLLVSVGVFSLPAATQDQGNKPIVPKHDVVKSSSQKSRGNGADPNIKGEYELNSAADGRPFPRPGGKSDERGSARGCAVDVNNYSPLFVQIYADGYYAGTVGPWGDVWVYPGTGGTLLYARANFTDGSYVWWSNRFGCAEAGIYEWRISR